MIDEFSRLLTPRDDFQQHCKLARGDSPYFNQKPRINKWYASERPRRGNKCEFQHNRLPSTQTSRDRSPTYPTNFFLLLRPSPFSRPPVQTTVNRTKINRDVFVDRLFPTHNDGDNSESSFDSRFFASRRRIIPIFRICNRVCTRFRSFRRNAPGTGVEKVIVCFAQRVLHRVFPDPEMSVFFARWP